MSFVYKIRLSYFLILNWKWWISEIVFDKISIETFEQNVMLSQDSHDHATIYIFTSIWRNSIKFLQ